MTYGIFYDRVLTDQERKEHYALIEAVTKAEEAKADIRMADAVRDFAKWWDDTVPEIDTPEYDLGLLDGTTMQRYAKDYLAGEKS